MMITDELLLEKGYKEYEPNIFFNPYSNRFFQKEFKNEKGQTRYFVNLVEYGGDEDNEITYNVDLQFDKENYTMNITIFSLAPQIRLEEIEQEIEEIWFNLDCKYYSLD